MRKIVILAGLLLGAAMLTGATPANAAIGCMCAKFGAPLVCTATINDCFKMGGACIAPCILDEPKAAKGGKKPKAKKAKMSKKKK